MENRIIVYPFDDEEAKLSTNNSLVENQQSLANPAADTILVAERSSHSMRTSMAFQVLKIITTGMFASASSLSIPIFIIVMKKAFDPQENMSIEQKILAPLIPYLFFISLRYWLVWNNMGHRLNGHIDTDIPISDNSYAQDSSRIVISFLANLTSFTNAFLAINAGLSTARPPTRLGAATILGGLSYTVDLYTDVIAAFRKHVESKQTQGHEIAPFFKQKYAKSLDKHALTIANFLRELLPIVRGVIWAKITTYAISTTFSSSQTQNAITIINHPVGIITYWAVAYSTRFEMVQLENNLRAAGKNFEIETTLSRSSNTLLRLTGKASNGQILIDLLKKIKLTTRASVNTTLTFSSLSLIALLLQALHTYVSNTQSNNQDNTLLINYCAGDTKAAQIAPKVEIAMACVAVSLGIVGTFARSAIIHKYARNKEAQIEPAQIAAGDDNTELVARPI